jgi:hypothetical protein
MTLVGAEILKLVRRRGLMLWSLFLTTGSVLIAEIVLVALHAANSAHHGPAGGARNLEHFVFLIGGLGNVAAIIIGATAGTQDVQNGVFRDLVVTGRSRSTLFRVRAPGALAVLYPMLALGFAVAIGGSFLLAGGLPRPTAHALAHEALYVLAITTVDTVVAVGLAAFVSSRIVVGVLIAWNAIVSQLLIQTSLLGGARKAIDVAAAESFAPHDMIGNPIAMSAATAVLVLVVWAALFSGAGRFWTIRRDA